VFWFGGGGGTLAESGPDALDDCKPPWRGSVEEELGNDLADGAFNGSSDPGTWLAVGKLEEPTQLSVLRSRAIVTTGRRGQMGADGG
jgi:hypothetical protein